MSQRLKVIGQSRGRTKSCRSLWLIVIILSPALLNIGIAQTDRGQINNIRFWHSPNKSRVVFDVSSSIKHTVFSLKKPERLVVDIEGAKLTSKLPISQSENSRIKLIRSGSPSEGVLRFVFELKKPLDAHSFLLTPNELYGFRLVLDLLDQSDQAVADETQYSVLPNGDSSVRETSLATSRDYRSMNSNSSVSASNDLERSGELGISESVAAVNRSERKIVVAIDAGHGGEDPGAIGHRGSREKKITLSIAKRLKRIIDSDPRMRASLVREGDYYIDLTRRRTLARERGADIFVSIHADAFSKKSANGLSVFALSQRGATSAMAKALAEKENAADLIGGVSLANKDPVLAKVLVDLSITNTISESVNLGGRVLKELAKVGRLHSKRVEQASFVVLKSPDIPSILVETGFITNLGEEKKLRTAKYQTKIAKAIHRAIGDYIEQTPYYNKASYASPSIAVLDTESRLNKHRIRKGDSLSSIAVKYDTSVSELKRLNNLSSDTAVLGKTLILPGTGKPGVEPSSNSAEPFIHRVVSGDSLSKISARYNVTIRSIKRLNGLSRNSIYRGQELKIPAEGKVNKAKHKVTRGDTLSEIAQQYGVSVRAIMSTNGLTSKVVRLGQTLTIPR